MKGLRVGVQVAGTNVHVSRGEVTEAKKVRCKAGICVLLKKMLDYYRGGDKFLGK